MKRQAWQDLRRRFVISHSFVAGQLYSMLPETQGQWETSHQMGKDPGNVSISKAEDDSCLLPAELLSDRHGAVTSVKRLDALGQRLKTH